MTVLDEDSSSPLEELKTRHKKEKKELQAQLTKLKNQAKNDKKRKKEILAEADRLQKEIEERHKKELEEFNPDSTSSISNGDDEALQRFEAERQAAEKAREKARLKHEKNQEKKEEFNKKMAKLAAEQAVADLTSKKTLEAKEIQEKLDIYNRIVYEIAPDGDCLFNSISHQLSQQGIVYSGEDLRKIAAQYITDHKDDFFPYLMIEEDQFDRYISETANPAAAGGKWGGHPELKAISDYLKKKIEVVQSEMRNVIIGEEYEGSPIIITYHKNAYGLGEHYNSTVVRGTSV
uniref:OTU domain-containing protein n=1 Tax=Strongyloides papillosus TaxID=174720 RepID=A0A0N5CHD1_STREA